MKKLIVFSILLVLINTAGFSQEADEFVRDPAVPDSSAITDPAVAPNPVSRGRWSFSGEAQVFSDLFYYTSAEGKIETVTGGVTTTDTWGENIKGSFNLMNSSIGPAPGFWSAIYINCVADNYELALQLVLYEYFTRGPDYNTVFTNKSVRLIDIFGFIFGDWHLKGNVGIFEGYMGNTGYGGYVPVYDNFSDWCNFKFERFYVNKMGDRQITNNMDLWGGGSAFALGANFTDNFRLAIGTDFGFGGDRNTNPSTTAWTNPYASANSFNIGAMFSGRGIANIVSFDLFGGVFGSDQNLNERGKYNPLGPGPHNFNTQVGGSYKIVFGEYTGINLMDWLGISIGYSGEFTIYEKQGYDKNNGTGTPDYHSYDLVSPLWSSVHLHVEFTRINRLTLTFNNNFSFAGTVSQEVKAGEHPDRIVLALADGLSDYNAFRTLANNFSGWNAGEKESWFGYDAALGAAYRVTDSFELCLQLVNQLGIYNHTTNNTSSSRTANNFYTVLNAQYNIGFVTIAAGLSFGIETTIYDAQSGSDTMNASNNVFKLGMPLVFKVAF